MNKDVIHMSLSDLLKKSAMQICYLRKNKEKVPETTEAQQRGNDAALEKAGDNKYVEMRGTYRLDRSPEQDILIHYSFDEIFPNDVACLFIEHKNITDGSTVEHWYKNSSLLQTATYQAFAENNDNKLLQTANFYVQQDNPKLEFELGNRYLRSELHLGDQVYTVLPIESKTIVAFFLSKAIATLDYTTAKDWDNQYKHKEYDTLHTNVKYNLLQQSGKITVQ